MKHTKKKEKVDESSKSKLQKINFKKKNKKKLFLTVVLSTKLRLK